MISRAPLVIKVGGALLDDAAAMTALFNSIHSIREQRPVVIVHGGGPMVESLMADLGLVSEKLDGLRVTPDNQMPYICGALAGTANKQLCAAAISTGIVPVGLSLLDGNMIQCQVLDEKYGAVGTPSAGESAFLKHVLAQAALPIISSIGSTSCGRLLNINADQAATVIAELLDADLLLLSNVEGVLDGDKVLIPELDEASIAQYCDAGVILDGMKVKVDAAMQSAITLARPVIIASWVASISDILNNTTGTKIVPPTPTTSSGDDSGEAL